MLKYVFTRGKCKRLQKTYGKTQNIGVDCEKRKRKCEHAIHMYSHYELSSFSKIYKEHQNQRKFNSVRHKAQTVDINAYKFSVRNPLGKNSLMRTKNVEGRTMLRSVLNKT
jgi:hypothetical protein